jgi:hypothetical protein
LELPGVAAAEVDHVRVEDGEDLVEHAAHPLVPLLPTDLAEGPVADVLLVGEFLAERVVGQLQVRDVDAVDEEGAAHAGAEGDHHLDALAGDGAVALHTRVVEGAGGLAGELFDLGAEGEAGPALVEVGGGVCDVLLDHPREPHRHPVEGRERFEELLQGREHRLGGRGPRRGHALPLAEVGARLVQHDGLDPGTADVDAQRPGA